MGEEQWNEGTKNHATLTQGKGTHFCFFPDCSDPVGPWGALSYSLFLNHPRWSLPPLNTLRALPLPSTQQGASSFPLVPRSPTSPLITATPLHKHSHFSFWALYPECSSSMLFFTLRNPVDPSILSLRTPPIVCSILKCAPLIFQSHPSLGVAIRNFAEVVQVPN